MAKKVCVIPGDGVGPEVVGAAMEVLEALAPDLEYTFHRAGLQCRRDVGEYLPRETLDAAREADAVLFGAITSPLPHEDPTYRSVILALRIELDLYANVRPAKDWGQPCLRPGVDLVIVRENTEDLYNVPEKEDAEGVTTYRRITRRATRRAAQAALRIAAGRPRRSLTIVHKANVIRAGDGLFRAECYAAAKERPEVRVGDALVDSVAFQLVVDPGKHDVLVAPNLYGDILTDVAAGVAGGLGFAPSGSYGPRSALFEPVHGSAPDIAGKGVANPTAAILSAAMMLHHIGEERKAQALEAGVSTALAMGERTRDAGGAMRTTEFARAVARRL